MRFLRQTGLVAGREVRERVRSRGFLAGLAVMLALVVAAIVLPSLVDTDRPRDVGLTGRPVADLPAAIRAQGQAVDTTMRIHPYADVAAGREAVRRGDIDVLVVDGRQLEWRDEAQEPVQAVVTAAIQMLAVRDRAAAAGIGSEQLAALLAPVAVTNVVLGPAEGRSPEDGTAAILITALLLTAVFVYGNLVLTGVVEEKSSRVVEVLLARMSPRTLLVGKVTGIGLLGLAQFVVTALAALAAGLVVDSVDVPAVSGRVLTWVVVWFVLGYALYATVYGALGSLASRSEDAQNIAGPVGYVLIAGYWASFLAVSNDPDSTWSRVVSLFPPTAPFAMPGRIALDATAWWEPPVAVVLTVAAIAGLVAFGARVYTNAVLHSGPALRLRDAWHIGRARHAVDPGGP